MSTDPIKVQIDAARPQVQFVLDQLIVKSSDADPTYYQDFHWFAGGENGGAEVRMGHAALAAAVYAYSRNSGYLTRAIDSFNAYLNEQGATAGGDINMGFFGAQLGLARLMLDPYLPVAVKDRWNAALKEIVDYWRVNRNIPLSLGGYAWYTNGNIEAWETLVTYYAQRFNPAHTYLVLAHEAQKAFMLDPPANAGGGYNAGENAGLRYLVQPMRVDGSDGKGFLTENGGPGGPIGAGWGYDPYYTMVQESAIAAWAAASGDPDAIRLLNLLVNTNLGRSNTTTWVMDATGGTRRSFYTPYVCSGMFELGPNRHRDDLLRYLQSNWAEVLKQYNPSSMTPGKSRGMGTVLGTIVYSGLRYYVSHP